MRSWRSFSFFCHVRYLVVVGRTTRRRKMSNNNDDEDSTDIMECDTILLFFGVRTNPANTILVPCCDGSIACASKNAGEMKTSAFVPSKTNRVLCIIQFLLGIIDIGLAAGSATHGP
jgi:hypothetical protein